MNKKQNLKFQSFSTHPHSEMFFFFGNTIYCGISMGIKPIVWVKTVMLRSWVLLRKGSNWLQMDLWLKSEHRSGLWSCRNSLTLQKLLSCSCCPAAFLHLQKAPISCHRLLSLHWGCRRCLPFILDFSISWEHSAHSVFRCLIAFFMTYKRKCLSAPGT